MTTEPHPYFIDRAESALMAAHADSDADPMPLARWGQGLMDAAEDTALSGALVTRDGQIVACTDYQRAMPGRPAAWFVHRTDLDRLGVSTPLPDATGLLQVQPLIERTLGEAVVHIESRDVTKGAPRE